MISGLLLIRWTWPSIFWFTSIAAPIFMFIMILFLPETCRRLVSNGSGRTSYLNTPFIPILRPKVDQLTVDLPLRGQPKKAPKLPNPLSVLSLLRNRGTLAAVVCYGIYYMVHSCLQASLSTVFIDVYHLSGLAAGLIYIPFGVACSIASVAAGMSYLNRRYLSERSITKLKSPPGKNLDRDYRVTAQAQGLTINRVCGDDLLTFPIERARLRTHKYSIIICACLIATYGWVLHAQVVIVTCSASYMQELTKLAYSSPSSPSVFNRILQPSSLYSKKLVIGGFEANINSH